MSVFRGKWFDSRWLRLAALLCSAVLLFFSSWCYVFANDNAGMGEIFTYTDFRNTEAYGNRLREASGVMESLARQVYDGRKISAVDLDNTAIDGAFHYYFYADGVTLTDIPLLEGVDFSHAKTLAVYQLGLCYLMDTDHTQTERYVQSGEYSWKPFDLTKTVSLSVFSCDAGAILVPDENWISDQYSVWDTAKDRALLFILLICFAVLPMVYLILSESWRTVSDKEKRRPGVFTEILIVFGVGAVVFLLQILDVSYLRWLRELFSLFGYGSDRAVYFAFSFLFTALGLVVLHCVLALIRSGRESRILRGSFTWWFCRRPYEALRRYLSRNRRERYRYSFVFSIRTLVFLLIEAVLLTCFVLTAINQFWIVVQFFLLFAVLLVAILYFYGNYRDLRSLNQLLDHISALQEGNLSFRASIPEEDVFSPYEAQLRSVGDGFDQTLRSQIAAERSRVNLITNVSHDLRTPLTSIIGYLDLLSKAELSPEAMDYVRILTEKSSRLNHLVSDVFALSKANSGAEEVAMEDLDLFLLARQLVADLSDSAAASGKTVLLTGAGNAPVRSNGNKLYRILQNMLDNALKYSLPGTRVFVSLKESCGAATVTVKNTASYEMNFTSEEISEQFVRGDPSRTGEGSGLGLAIAKSFAEQLGADFSIEIDGDQFISAITLPLKTEEDSNGLKQEEE